MVTAFGATASHGDLPREHAVISAVEDLLRDGACKLPPVPPATIQNLTPIEEAPAIVLEESVSDELSPRLRTGIFTERDATFLLRSDHTTSPGTVGSNSAA